MIAKILIQTIYIYFEKYKIEFIYLNLKRYHFIYTIKNEKKKSKKI